MAYWLDDGFDTWPEVVRAGKAATGLYVCCGAWIARSISNGSITDAVIPAEVATMYGTPEWITKLIAVGLWSIEGDGYRDLRYFGLNPTADELRTKRAARVAAGRKGGLASGNTRRRTNHSSKPEANASAHAQANGAARASPIVEPPSLPSPPTEGGRAARPRNATGAARCPQHPHELAHNCRLCAAERLAPPEETP